MEAKWFYFLLLWWHQGSVPAPYTSGKCSTTEPHPQFPAFSLGPSEVRIKYGAQPETEVVANTARHLKLNREDSTRTRKLDPDVTEWTANRTAEVCSW